MKTFSHRGAWSLVLLCVALSSSSGFARDLAGMSASDITALQSRLAEARCYSGPLDGAPSAATEKAMKSCPTQDPVLIIDPAMHIAPAMAMAVDKSCRVAATASYDKTVRLWSLPDGALKATYRMPVGPDNGGKPYAVAISSDGGTLAMGGWDAAADGPADRHALYLVETATGNVRRIGALKDVILHVAFSPDDRRVAVSQVNGVVVYDLASGREIMSDLTYGARSQALTFGRDGALYTTSYDGYVRRYGADLRASGKLKAPGGAQPYGIAVDPSDTRLAVGYLEGPAVTLIDARSLKVIGKAETADIKKDEALTNVAWTASGTLMAGGGFSIDVDGKWKNALRRFTPDGAKAGDDLPLSDNTITALTPCGDGLAYVAADPRFGLIGADGTVSDLHGPVTSEMRGKKGNALTVSENGLGVRFGRDYRDGAPVLFDVLGARLIDAPDVPEGYAAARIEGLKVTNWEDTDHPALAGKPIELKSYEFSRSLAIRPARDGFVLGTKFRIRAYDAGGRQRWEKTTPSDAWGVDVTPDGRIVVAALGDGTIRWYRASDGAELLALFVHRADRRWITWTPSGYYMASPGGEDLIGWQVNRGWDQAPDFFPASRFRDRFARPDVVQAVLATLDEDKAVQSANAAAKKKEATLPIEARLPPVVTLQAPQGGASFSGDSVTLDYAVRSPSGLAVTGVDILIDGRPATEARGLSRLDPAKSGNNACLAEASRGVARVEKTCRVTLSLPQHDVEVAILARAGDLAGEPDRLRLTYKGAETPAADLMKPKLYVLAVGVADYVDPALKLGLAAKDATDFAAAMKTQQGGLYREVEVKLLADRDATHDSVLEGLDWLEKQVTSRDVGVVFLAGHGVMDEKSRFFYLPADASVEKLKTRAIPKDAIMDAMTGLAGKAILFLDSCHAAGVASGGTATRGDVDVNGFVNELASSENGVVVFGSSTGRELSQESAEWGNGAFTKAVIEGIAEGKADLLGKGTVTLSSLDAYVAERVKSLTGGRQHPVMAKPATITNFPLALVRK
jgi:WD40 repeat protein